jgi:mRNA interferase MazF
MSQIYMKIWYNPWDILLCPFQFTNGQWSKHRPVVVLSQERDDYLVAAISTKIDQWWAFDIIIKPSEQNGLRKKSIIRLSKLFSFSEDVFVRQIWTIDIWYRKNIKNNMQKFVESWK